MNGQHPGYDVDAPARSLVIVFWLISSTATAFVSASTH
jgi:hypothetical protein